MNSVKTAAWIFATALSLSASASAASVQTPGVLSAETPTMAYARLASSDDFVQIGKGTAVALDHAPMPRELLDAPIRYVRFWARRTMAPAKMSEAIDRKMKIAYKLRWLSEDKKYAVLQRQFLKLNSAVVKLDAAFAKKPTAKHGYDLLVYLGTKYSLEKTERALEALNPGFNGAALLKNGSVTTGEDKPVKTPAKPNDGSVTNLTITQNNSVNWGLGWDAQGSQAYNQADEDWKKEITARNMVAQFVSQCKNDLKLNKEQFIIKLDKSPYWKDAYVRWVAISMFDWKNNTSIVPDSGSVTNLNITQNNSVNWGLGWDAQGSQAYNQADEAWKMEIRVRTEITPDIDYYKNTLKLNRQQFIEKFNSYYTDSYYREMGLKMWDWK